jgi:hypothetical protein
MRGADPQQSSMFSHISAEQRVPKDHPVRAIRIMVDAALTALRPQLDAMYAKGGPPPIPTVPHCKSRPSTGSAPWNGILTSSQRPW